MLTDAELLRRYARDRDERAFAELVQRHLGVVYGAALRRTGGRTHLAEEIAQKIFTDLARKAVVLSSHPALTGWLHRSTRYAAIDAARAERRGQKLSESLAAMADTNSPLEAQVEWSHLRPVLDEVLDELKESDREAMLLRYFEGLSFAEVGERLRLSENAARMRTERALEKLRAHLGRRGITSTGSALGMALANQALASAPAGLATAVTSSALASAPASIGVLTFLLMNKTLAPAVVALLAAGATTLVWTTAVPGITAAEIADLRAENSRLTQAAASASGAEAESARQAADLVAKLRQKIADKNAAATGQHRYHGQATPKDAFLSYAWAIDAGEVDALMQLITFEEQGREAVRALHSGMPEAVRKQYPTPEEFMAFLYVADALLNPVPGPDVAAGFITTEVRPGVVAVHRPGTKRGGMKFVETTEGWKCVVPDAYPAHVARRVLSNEMLGKLGIN